MGRAAFFFVVLAALLLMSRCTWVSGQNDVASLPKPEEFTVIEGPLTEVALEECSYVLTPRRGRPFCVDLLVMDVEAAGGLRTVRVHPQRFTSFLNTVEEWQPLRGQRARISVLGQDHGRGSSIYDFWIGDRHLVRYEQIVERTRKGVIAGQIFLWVMGGMFLLVIAIIPIPRFETTATPTPAKDSS